MRLRVPSAALLPLPSAASVRGSIPSRPSTRPHIPVALRSFTPFHRRHTTAAIRLPPLHPLPLPPSQPTPIPTLRPASASLSSSPLPPPLLCLAMFPFSLLSSMPWWALAFLCYASVSGVLLSYPELLFPLRPKKAEVSFPIRYGAHRGGGGERPENTLAAFDHAVECGCTLLELDVHLTRDGHVVVFHDASTLRTTGRAMQVTDSNYQDLPMALSRMPAPPPFSPPGTLMTYRIEAPEGSAEYRHAYGAPLLRTVLQRYTQSVVNIDMKDDSDALLDATEAVVREERAEHRVIWGSVHQRMADRLRARNPHGHQFYTPRDILQLYALFLTGLLPFSPLPAQYLEIPFITQYARDMLVSRLTPRVGPFLAERVGGALLQWLGRRPSLFLHLKARGCPVVLWVVNDETEMREAYDTGAVGVMTDFPSLMQRVFSVPAGKVPDKEAAATSDPARAARHPASSRGT